MGKINFTAEHKARLGELVVDYTLTGETIQGTVGQNYSVFDLFHGINIPSLKPLIDKLDKAISNKETSDEWGSGDTEQRVLASLKKKRELVNLIWGYRRFEQEKAESAAEIKALEREIALLEESEKTPADRIAEKKAKLDALKSF